MYTKFTDLSGVAEYLSNVSLHGEYLTALCPFHDDKHPSFFVNEEYYNCMGCQTNGKTIDLIPRLEGEEVHTYEETERVRNPFMGWIKRYKSLSGALIQAYRVGQQFPTQMSYVIDRGLTDESIKRYRIGWLDGWITFPALDRNKKVIGATARLIRGNARYMTPKDQNKDVLFIPDWSRLNNFSYVYLVFGIMDALTMAQAGYPVITTMTGINPHPEPFSGIRKTIYVIPDKGEEKQGTKLVAGLGWRGRLVKIDWPEGCKDINDVWVKDNSLLKRILHPVISEELIKEMGF